MKRKITALMMAVLMVAGCGRPVVNAKEAEVSADDATVSFETDDDVVPAALDLDESKMPFSAEDGNKETETAEVISEEEPVVEETVAEGVIDEEVVEEEVIEEDIVEETVSKSNAGNIASGNYRGSDNKNGTWQISANGKLTVNGKGDYTMHDAEDNSKHNLPPWYEYADDIISAEISITSTEGNLLTSTRNMFRGAVNMQSVEFKELDTSNVTNMSGMFDGCNRLEALNLSGFNTAKVEDMSWMFALCSDVDKLDLGSFDTSSVENMHSMFDGCYNLSELRFGDNFNTENVTDMTAMFSYCNDIEWFSINFDTSKVTSMRMMFKNCKYLESVTFEETKNTSSVTDMSYMFSNCGNLTTVNFEKLDTSKVTYIDGMFEGCGSIESIDMSGFDLSSIAGEVKDEVYIDGEWVKQNVPPISNRLFDGCYRLITVKTPTGLRSDYNNVSLPNRFGGTWKDSDNNVYTCLPVGSGESKVLTLDETTLENVKSGNVIWSLDENGLLKISGSGSYKEAGENVPSWWYRADRIKAAKIESLTDIDSTDRMFYECTELRTVDLSGLDKSNITKMGFMFRDCRSLESIDFSGFDTSHVTSFISLVSNCENLESLDLSSFDTSNAEDMRYMFYGCTNLKNLTLGEKFSTANAMHVTGMFENCRSLKKIDCSSFDLSKLVYDTGVNYDQPFRGFADGCTSLMEIMTPLNLAEAYTISLPVIESKVWIDENRKVWNKFPANQTSSKKLTLRDMNDAEEHDKDLDFEPDAKIEEEVKYSIYDTLEPFASAAKIDSVGTKKLFYNGKPYTPTPKVRIGDKVLKNGVDYRFEYENNVNAGEAKIYAVGMGRYKEERSEAQTFKIEKKNFGKLKFIACPVVLESSATTLTADQIQKSVMVYDGAQLLKYGNDYSVNLSDPTAQITGKSVKVEVAASASSANYDETKKTVKVGIVRIKEGKKPLPEASIVLSGPLYYTGKALTPKVTVEGLTLNTHYKVKYSNNKNAGMGYATVTGKGDYSGTQVVPFEITALAQKLKIEGSFANIKYSGALRTPKVTVKAVVSVGGTSKVKKLAKNKDYTVRYVNNLNSGNAYVEVTGIGNYEGSFNRRQFTILRLELSKATIKVADNKVVLTYKNQILKPGYDYELESKRASGSKYLVTYHGLNNFSNVKSKKVAGSVEL